MIWDKLINIKWWIYLLSTLGIGIFGLGIVYIMIQNVDNHKYAKLTIDNKNNNIIKTNGDIAYKLKVNEILKIYLNDKDYEYKIKNIKIDKDKQFLIYIEAVNAVAPLLPNTEVNISFTNGKQKIYELFIK